MVYRFIILTLISFSVYFTLSSCNNQIENSLNKWQIDSLQIEDTHIHYEYLNNDSKRTLVFIHPGMLDSEVWKPQVAHFRNNYNVLLYDMPAHGRSGLRNASLLEHEYMDQLLQELKIQKITLIGASLGSIVATEFALENPDKVEQLVLASPGINGEVPNDKQYVSHINNYVRNMTYHKYIEAATSLTYIAFIGPKRTAIDMDSSMLNNVKEKIYHHIEKGFWKESPYFLTPTSNSRLEEIKIPSLLLLGSEDFDYLSNTTTRLSEKLPNVKMEYIMGAGHLSNLESPKVFNSLMSNFLDGYEGK
jgi:pimeloyl-ACP methyl ester carboxylesterase